MPISFGRYSGYLRGNNKSGTFKAKETLWWFPSFFLSSFQPIHGSLVFYLTAVEIVASGSGVWHYHLHCISDFLHHGCHSKFVFDEEDILKARKLQFSQSMWIVSAIVFIKISSILCNLYVFNWGVFSYAQFCSWPPFHSLPLFRWYIFATSYYVLFYIFSYCILHICRYWIATSLEGSPYHGFTSNGRYPAQVCITLFNLTFRVNASELNCNAYDFIKNENREIVLSPGVVFGYLLKSPSFCTEAIVAYEIKNVAMIGHKKSHS
jgi:hypothetical protein